MTSLGDVVKQVSLAPSLKSNQTCLRSLREKKVYKIMDVVLCVERMNIEQQCEQLDKEIVHAVTNLLQEISPEECLSLINSTLLSLQANLDNEDDTLSWLSNSTPGVGKSQLDSESCSVQEVRPSTQSLSDVNISQTDLTPEQANEPQASLREAELHKTTDNQPSIGDFRCHPAENAENLKTDDDFPRRHRPSMMDDLRRKQAKERRAKRSKEKQLRSGGSMFAAALMNVGQSSGRCASDEVMVNRRKDDGLTETAVTPKICSKRKRKLEDLEYSRCNDIKNSDIKRAKIVEEDVNNNDVTHLTHKYNICPKTGKLFQKAKVKMLSAKNRRIKLRKQPNLLIQAVRRNMLVQAMHARKSCCPKRCFLRQPKL